MPIANSMKRELIELEAEMQMKPDYGCLQVQCYQLIQLLFNPKITTFTFPPDFNSYDLQPAASDLWQSLVAARLPNLHTIITENSWFERPFFINSLLPVVPQLEVLRLIQYECEDTDLIKIAQHLPKLR
jgi:hypothetical protein